MICGSNFPHEIIRHIYGWGVNISHNCCIHIERLSERAVTFFHFEKKEVCKPSKNVLMLIYYLFCMGVEHMPHQFTDRDIETWVICVFIISYPIDTTLKYPSNMRVYWRIYPSISTFMDWYNKTNMYKISVYKQTYNPSGWTPRVYIWLKYLYISAIYWRLKPLLLAMCGGRNIIQDPRRGNLDIWQCVIRL